MAHVTHELDVPCEQLHSRAWLTRNEVGDARCPCRCAKARPVRNGSVEPVHEQQSLHHIVHVSNERCALRASAEPKAKRTVMLIVRGRVPSCTMYIPLHAVHSRYVPPCPVRRALQLYILTGVRSPVLGGPVRTGGASWLVPPITYTAVYLVHRHSAQPQGSGYSTIVQLYYCTTVPVRIAILDRRYCTAYRLQLYGTLRNVKCQPRY